MNNETIGILITTIGGVIIASMARYRNQNTPPPAAAAVPASISVELPVVPPVPVPAPAPAPAPAPIKTAYNDGTISDYHDRTMADTLQKDRFPEKYPRS